MNKSKAQISIEYLILIAAVLAITAIVVAMVTNVFSGQQSDVQYQMCRQAAASCALSLKTNSQAECSSCADQCMDVRDRTDIISRDDIDVACKKTDSACGMCKQGWANEIDVSKKKVVTQQQTQTGGEQQSQGFWEDLFGSADGDIGPPPALE